MPLLLRAKDLHAGEEAGACMVAKYGHGAESRGVGCLDCDLQLLLLLLSLALAPQRGAHPGNPDWPSITRQAGHDYRIPLDSRSGGFIAKLPQRRPWSFLTKSPGNVIEQLPLRHRWAMSSNEVSNSFLTTSLGNVIQQLRLRHRRAMSPNSFNYVIAGVSSLRRSSAPRMTSSLGERESFGSHAAGVQQARGGVRACHSDARVRRE